jgi:acetyl-CoA carboxylase biotin carboxyl carrier protein
VQLDFEQLQALLSAVQESDISELSLKGESFELLVKRGSTTAVVLPQALPPAPVSLPTTASAPPAQTPSAPSAVAPGAGESWVEITSPMVGTFYRAPAPEEPPFINVGDRIRPGQTVCIIEAMKLMNELESEVSGEVVEVLAQNGEPVEFNQPLMRIRPL